MQRVALLADDDGVPGVVAALVPDDVVDAVAEQVGRLALALIAPLGAYDHDGGHEYRLSSAGGCRSLAARATESRIPPPAGWLAAAGRLA